MAIDIANDIKLMASENMSDTDEGGGRMSGVEIIGGQTNNIFPDISRMDRTIGRVSLRKVYPACLSENQDVYYGAHVIITDPPDDYNVKCWMLTTRSVTDRRRDAKNVIEGYVIRDGRFIGYLWGDHPAGLSVLRIVTPPDYPNPDIGDVLNLYFQNKEQFVKIIAVSSEVRTFQIQGSGGVVSVTRKIMTITITPRLAYDFKGTDIIEPTLPPPGTTTDIYKTFGVDRTNYYGVATLARPATKDDLVVNVDSIFTQIVPVNRAESPLVDMSLASVSTSSAESLLNDSLPVPSCSYSVYLYLRSGLTLYTGASIAPRTLRITCSAGTWTDDGLGNLIRNNTVEGYVDYNAGQILFLSTTANGWYTITVSFERASMRYKIKFTQSQAVTVATQGATWIFALEPLPQPGSVLVDFRSQGKWYRLVDSGTGSLVPEQSGVGGGTINYSTGSLVVTFNALPDVGSEVICYWDNPDERIAFHYYKTSVTHDDMWFEYVARNTPVGKNSVTITWQEGATTKTLTDNGNGGLVGDGSGTINYNNGVIRFLPNSLVAPNTAFTISYAYGDPIVETFTHPGITEFLYDGGTYWDSGQQKEKVDYGWIDLVLQEQPVPGSIKVDFDCDYIQGHLVYITNYVYTVFSTDPHVTLYDTCDGKLALASGIIAKMDVNARRDEATFQPFSIDYENKKIRLGTYLTLYHNVIKSRIYMRGNNHEVSYDRTDIDFADYVLDPANVVVTVSYYSQSGTNSAQETFTSPLFVNLRGNKWGVRLAVNSTVINLNSSSQPSSYNLLDSNTVFDYNGTLYRLIYNNNVFTKQAVGTVDREKCLATLSVWNSASSRPRLSISGEYTIPFFPVYSAVFRIPSPVRPASFILSFYAQGRQHTVMAAANGDISGECVSGKIDYNTGIVKVRFGKWIDKNLAVGAPWYDERLIQGDLIWQPVEVDAESIKYSAVTYSFIPVDPELIGLDPVKLPIDGRVPIFRSGYVVVVHNTKATTLPNNLQPGQQIVLPRGGLTYCDLYDANGLYVARNLYSVNLETGVITMSDPLDLSGYTQPLVAVHRIEDMKVAARVDINGQIYFTTPLKNSYTAGDTYVSSALVCGDLRAYVYNVFDQQTWTGVFSDTLIGNPCPANYNIVDYPIEVTNKGAIAERWAIVFTSSTTVNVIGETVGQILTNVSIASDIQPINPATQTPYFVIRAGGWGSGWTSGNVLRFNTTAAHYPVWLGRTVIPGEVVAEQDSFTIQVRGDAH